MSEIVALRTLVLDNINTLYSNFDTKHRFVLSCKMKKSSEQWTVVLGRPSKGGYAAVYDHGKGKTPEAAYRDLLKQTALSLGNTPWS